MFLITWLLGGTAPTKKTIKTYEYKSPPLSLFERLFLDKFWGALPGTLYPPWLAGSGGARDLSARSTKLGRVELTEQDCAYHTPHRALHTLMTPVPTRSSSASSGGGRGRSFWDESP